jgi:hypothetical protein
MEGSTAPIGTVSRADPGGIRLTQIGIGIASLGAALVIFDPFSLAVVGIFLAVGGTLLAAPGNVGYRWYIAIAIGAIVVALSRLVAENNELLGGWMAVIGAVTIMIGATLGFPVRGDRPR